MTKVEFQPITALEVTTEVFGWYESRKDYIAAREKLSDGSRVDMYNLEKQELNAAREAVFDKVIKNRNASLFWYQEEFWEDIWSYAGEGADLIIVGISKLKEMGVDIESVSALLSGINVGIEKTLWVEEFVHDVIQLRDEFDLMGIDMLRAVLEKSLLNDQHYSIAFNTMALLGVYLDDLNPNTNQNMDETFARVLRRGVGDPNTSQMPDLVASKYGATILATANKSPFGVNGSNPKAIYIRDEGVDVAGSDMFESYGLYQGVPELSTST